MSVIDEQIDILQKALDSGSTAERKTAVRDCIAICSFVPDIKKDLDTSKGVAMALGSPPPQYDYTGDARKLIGKLRAYQELSENLATDRRRMSINIDASSKNNLTANAYASASFSIEQAIQEVRDLSDLTEDEKDQLIGKLALIENEKDEGKRNERILSVFKWIVDKGFSVLQAVAPSLLQMVIGR